MPSQNDSFVGRPLLDLVSYGRRGPKGESFRLSHEQIDQIRRTVQRVPEVMVKVLPKGSHDLISARRHLDYISRGGKLELETDSGDPTIAANSSALLEDWDLEIDELRRQPDLSATGGKTSAKLVHKVMFSMPPGTPPAKVVEAVRNFAREEFAFKHRYAFVMHADEPHPHVHLMLKATSEHGNRLNIGKATLRHWRSEFARNLRTLGVAANATERAVRGQDVKALKDGIYRASLRGNSTFLSSKERFQEAAAKAFDRASARERELSQTRSTIFQAWASLAGSLDRIGQNDVAKRVAGFISEWTPPPRHVTHHSAPSQQRGPHT